MKHTFFLPLLISYSLHAQTSELWNVKNDHNGSVHIYKTDLNGDNMQIKYSFVDNINIYNGCLYEHGDVNTYVTLTNNKIYGITTLLGKFGKGFLFEYNILTKAYTKKLDIEMDMGNEICGSMTESSNGNMYGMFRSANEYNLILFEYNPVLNILKKKVEFEKNNVHGFSFGSLLKGNNGKLYGIVAKEENAENAILFEYDPVTEIYMEKDYLNYDTEIIKFANENISDIYNSKLFGIAGPGKSRYCTLFTYNSSLLRKKSIFKIKPEDFYPNALIEDRSGKLYGSTYRNGNFVKLFEYDLKNKLINILLDFKTDKDNTILYSINNKIYVLSIDDKANQEFASPQIYEYDLVSKKYTQKIEFFFSGESFNKSTIHICNDKLYVVENNGTSHGKLMEYDFKTNVYKVKIDFGEFGEGILSSNLIHSSNGNLYGLTKYGGKYGCGVLFQFNPVTNIYEKKIDFDSINYGSSPSSGLFQSVFGKLYGITSYGGTKDEGTLFEFDPITNKFSKKIDFDNVNKPEYLFKSTDNKLYITIQPKITPYYKANKASYCIKSADSSLYIPIEEGSEVLEYDPVKKSV